MKQRGLKELRVSSRDEVVETLRQAGVVGAGGGGFPTYFKYTNPQPHLIVNSTESEPGYWADKMLHKHHLNEFLLVYEALKAVFGFDLVSMCVTRRTGNGTLPTLCAPTVSTTFASCPIGTPWARRRPS